MNICSISNCGKIVRARGWCATHWSQWHRTGDPLGHKKRPSSLDLFMGMVEKTNGCWLWKGSKNNRGYGWCRRNYKLLLAHRVSYELFKGQIPTGSLVLHRCDVPSCVNPDHLFIGSQKDNAQDAVLKGHQKPSYACKLTWRTVMAIRDRYNNGEHNQSALAREYHVNSSTISRIVRQIDRLEKHGK